MALSPADLTQISALIASELASARVKISALPLAGAVSRSAVLPVVDAGSTQKTTLAQILARGFTTVPVGQDLRAMDVDTIVDGAMFFTTGVISPNDGGGGFFLYDAGSVATDNIGTVISPDSGVGRFLRVFSDIMNVKWFGASGDGATDDTDAITKAIAALPNGGSLFFPPGIFLMSGTGFVVPSNCTIWVGAGATLKVKNANNATTIIFSSGPVAGLGSVSNVTITGGGVLDGNAANQASGKQYGIHLRGNNLSVHGIEVKNIYDPTLAFGDAIFVQSLAATDSQNIRIFDCYLHDVGRSGISIVGARKWAVTNTQIENCGFMGIDCEAENAGTPVQEGQFTNVTITNCVAFGLGFVDNFGPALISNIVVTGCDISGITDDVTPNGDGILIRGATHIKVMGGFISDCVRAGIHVWRDATYLVVTSDILIQGVTVNNTGPGLVPQTNSHGIWLDAVNGFELTRIQVNANTVIAAGTVAGEMGIRATFTDNSQIINNTVKGSADAGIGPTSCDTITVTGNTSFGNGVAGAAGGIIIRSCTDVRIGQNTCYDDAGGVQNYGILVVDCNRVQWLGDNNLQNNATGAFFTSGTTNWFGAFFGQLTFPSGGTTMDAGSVFVRGSSSRVFLFPLTPNAGTLQASTEQLVHIKGSDVAETSFRLATASGAAAPAVADQTFDFLLETRDTEGDMS